VIDWFARRHGRLWYFVILTALGIVAPYLVLRSDPAERNITVFLLCVFAAQLFAAMYCAICELSAEVVKLRAELRSGNMSGSEK
jgi:hypothetical protein